MSGAFEEMQQAVKDLTEHVLYRANLALFAVYAGNFEKADAEVHAMPEPSASAIAALGLSQLGRNMLSEAETTYRQLQTMGARASFAVSGLGDLALYQGRFSDAIRILQEGAAADLAAN